MNKLLLGDLDENLQNNLPSLVVLEVSIEKESLGENDYLIKLRHFISSNTEKLISEAEGEIKWFENLAEGISCYYSTAINLIGISNKKIDTEKLMDFTSNRVLELITCNDNLNAVWEEFLTNAKSLGHKLGIIVGVNMASSLTFPLEHLKVVANEEDVKLLILKSSLKKPNVCSLNEKLPKRIAIILGRDYSGEDKLSFDFELKKIYELFGKLDNYDYSYIRALGGAIHHSKDGVEYTVDIFPQNCPLETVGDELTKINEPYLLIYTGHGVDTGINTPPFYPRGYLDGEIGIECNENAKTSRHIDFASILYKNPPRGIIFNCCNAIRGFSFRGKGSDDVEGPEGLESFESSYYKLLDKTKTKFIIAHRTKICGISANIKTVSLARNSVGDKSIIDMMIDITKNEYDCELEWRNDKKEYDKIDRDCISEVFWFN
jgi:hypothetical protein